MEETILKLQQIEQGRAEWKYVQLLLLLYRNYERSGRLLLYRHIFPYNKVGDLLFADDFVGITESYESLQQLIDIIYEFCSKWRLHEKINVNKSAVLVFGKDKVKGKWNWGDHVLPIASNYILYLSRS